MRWRWRRRKIGRSTILLVRRRASKQNAWSTSELFPFPATLASPSTPAPSLRLPGPRKLLPVAGAFFSAPSEQTSPLRRKPRRSFPYPAREYQPRDGKSWRTGRAVGFLCFRSETNRNLPPSDSSVRPWVSPVAKPKGSYSDFCEEDEQLCGDGCTSFW